MAAIKRKPVDCEDGAFGDHAVGNGLIMVEDEKCEYAVKDR